MGAERRRRRGGGRVLAAAAAIALAATAMLWRRDGAGEPPAVPPPVARLAVRVVASYPHDPAAFTQGLLWHDGSLYESTGHYGASELRQVEPASGAVLRAAKLPPELFGEGLARVGERLVQLTWREGTARVYELASFALVAEHRYVGEGWGLCFDGESLVMSDGSDQLVLRDPATFRETGRLHVHEAGRPVRALNELECVDGLIYANLLGGDTIVRIDRTTGAVEATIDASGLLTPAERAAADVLNGIAYDRDRRLFYLTGKWWPRLFAVELVPA